MLIAVVAAIARLIVAPRNCPKAVLKARKLGEVERGLSRGPEHGHLDEGKDGDEDQGTGHRDDSFLPGPPALSTKSRLLLLGIQLRPVRQRVTLGVGHPKFGKTANHLEHKPLMAPRSVNASRCRRI